MTKDIKEEKKVKNSVCAIVVTYNRGNLLIECLNALLKQTFSLDAIYIIDNSSTGDTPYILKENHYLTELPPENLKEPWEIDFKVKKSDESKIITIYYVRMNENTGGAGGFYEGVKRAYEKDYDWLWLMDDDAEPAKDALEKLSRFFDCKNVSALAGSVTFLDGSLNFEHRSYIDLNQNFYAFQQSVEPALYKNPFVEIEMASFVGLLINRKIVQKAGYPKKEFFIHHDDFEYCLRLHQIGRILLIPDSIIVHKEAGKDAGSLKKFLGIKSYRIPYDKLWLTYFSKRNLIWLGKKYSHKRMNYYLILIRDFLKSFTGIIFYDNNKWRRIKFLVNCYLDGLRGNFDNKKPQKILYYEIKNQQAIFQFL
ncbi:MAG TPA: glycosyltransferase family 2 protein [Paludibacteraceae bacterium]|nr:glycosyltransferase family 2 protein [Paludibacteraceae bacterium]HPO67972.1 glycosyltransferase family 2 protein [Paludibacteraceae bacterium]